jgi:hypothetical protein
MLRVGDKYRCNKDFHMKEGGKVLTKDILYEIIDIENKSYYIIDDDGDRHSFPYDYFDINHKKYLFVDLVEERKLKLDKLDGIERWK